MAPSHDGPPGQAAVRDLLWGQRPPGQRGPRPTLSVAEVARAGVAVGDAEGIGAVTMQRVADELGVTKMALYRYLPGKAELVALMIDIGLGEPPRLSDVPGGWRGPGGYSRRSGGTRGLWRRPSAFASWARTSSGGWRRRSPP